MLMGTLNAVTDSEYGNAVALFGLDGDLDSPEMAASLAAMPPLRRIQAINKLTQVPHASKGSRAEMEKHFPELPDHVRNQLKTADLRLADTIIFSVKPVSSKTIKIFESSDTKKTSLRSLSEGRLPKNQVMLVSGIIMLAGVAAGSSDDEVMSTNYAKIESINSIANGEFSLKANKKVIVPEGTSNRVFCTANFNEVPVGYYKLANPRLIHDDVSIELTVELGSLTGIAANTQLWVGLHGTITTP